MNKVHKSIMASLVLALIFTLNYRRRVFIASITPTATPVPTVTIEPELQRRADKELAPQVIFRLVALEDKLKNRDKFMQECRTLKREQMLERIEDLARIAGNCEDELKDR